MFNFKTMFSLWGCEVHFFVRTLSTDKFDFIIRCNIRGVGWKWWQMLLCQTVSLSGLSLVWRKNIFQFQGKDNKNLIRIILIMNENQAKSDWSYLFSSWLVIFFISKNLSHVIVQFVVVFRKLSTMGLGEQWMPEIVDTWCTSKQWKIFLMANCNV